MGSPVPALTTAPFWDRTSEKGALFQWSGLWWGRGDTLRRLTSSSGVVWTAFLETLVTPIQISLFKTMQSNQNGAPNRSTLDQEGIFFSFLLNIHVCVCVFNFLFYVGVQFIMGFPCDSVVKCPTLWPHGLYSPWNSPGQNTGVDNLALLLGIFPTQGLNPGLPHCRQILYQLSYQGSPRMLEWVAYPFSRGSS